MNKRVKAIAAATLAAAVVNFVGVLYFFEPIAAADSAGQVLLPPAVAFLIYIVLSALLLDWVVQQTGRPVRAGLIIAFSQMILVSIDFVLRGERGVATGAASALLILVTWSVVGAVYGKVFPAAGPDPVVDARARGV